MQDLIIMGIDPGTIVMGFGLIKIIKNNNIELIYLDKLLLRKYSNHNLKLKIIFEKTLNIIDIYHPNELAIESHFMGKNVKSMIKLGQAQGVAIAACLYKKIIVNEYSPKKIKMAITGNGNASKEQIAKMLKTLLNINLNKIKIDSTDGLATAVCHFLNKKNRLNKYYKYKDWNSFVKQNIDRIT
ncbi:MAG: crossover junction endodeoxyribonuclease RuvC [Candidatus Bostrichicola ureolyticus]|nr:MAG: crossover junction endodeoxyribonuclease RuvC [Candidatus Bostrichicola ureolyticus]WGH27403.1 MAG: crossover junction endodeoxyribonuclease RuvC [Candidatus Bostrichicola ureolyticus]